MSDNASTENSSPLLEVRNLTIEFPADDGSFTAVNDISFSVKKGSVLGIAGESGCGKSVTALSLLRLVPPPGRVSKGGIFFQGQDLSNLSGPELRSVRGKDIAMIFQEPMNSLNPVFTIGRQITDTIRLHRPSLKRNEIKEEALKLLSLVRFPSPEEKFQAYPHQLSGGTRQRVMIAMALSCKPQLLIADEPTTALDVTIQAQILDLLRKLQAELKTSLILITHDMGVVAEMCDEVLIMYSGQIVEAGLVDDLFHQARHPYTQGLLESNPAFAEFENQRKLQSIPGMAPSPKEKIRGCRFYDRCSRGKDLCQTTPPSLAPASLSRNHYVACHFPLQAEALK